MLRSRKGFTLIELLICVFIIAILIAIIVPSGIALFSLSRDDNTQQVEVMTQEQEAALNEKVTSEQPATSAPEEQEVKSTDKGSGKLL